jgi:fibronectin type 3 domain-containing protein
MSTKKVLRTVVVGVVALLGLHACVDGSDNAALGSVESELAPPPPTGLTVVNVRSDRQDLNWTPVAGAAKYIIMRGLAGPGSETSYTECCLTGPPFIAGHLTPSTNYCWQVKSVAANGESSGPSNEVCLSTSAVPVVPPPATVTATAISASRINVDWSAVAGATKYRIFQSEAGGPFLPVGSIIPPTLTFQKANLIAGTQYCYTVVVDTVDGSSVPSAPACATTFALGLEGYWKFDEQSGTTANDSSGFGRTATLSGGAAFSATLPKAPLDDNKSMLNTTATSTGAATTAAVGSFRLTGAFSIALWVRQPAAGTDLKILGMHNAGSCGAGALGWELSQSTAGLAFISQTGTRNFGQSLVVGDWTHIAVTYPGGAGATMRLYINGVEVATGAYSASNSLSAAMSFGHVGGCAGGQVILDEAQIYSRQLSATEVGTFGTLPPAPTNLTITKNNSTVQDLAWTAPAGGASKWIIMRGVGPTGPGNETNYTHAPNPPTTFNGDHLTPNTQYAWKVKTVNNNLVSLPSNEVIATTNDVPAAPTGVNAIAISQTRINISWTAVPNATKYYIRQSISGGPFSPRGSVLAPAVTFQAANLTANTTYAYDIQAEDAGLSRSAFSAPASATTFP